MKRIETFLNARGKTLIGWDEILEGGLPPRAAVMSWRGVSGGFEAALQAHDVVMSPTSHCYFDYPQAASGEPEAINAPVISLCKVYSFEPVPPDLPADKAGHILGTQGNLWTEHVATAEHARFMLFPRAIALAEVGWTDKKLKNFTSFSERMNAVYPRLDDMGINYRAPKPGEEYLCGEASQ